METKIRISVKVTASVLQASSQAQYFTIEVDPTTCQLPDDLIADVIQAVYDSDKRLTTQALEPDGLKVWIYPNHLFFTTEVLKENDQLVVGLASEIPRALKPLQNEEEEESLSL